MSNLLQRFAEWYLDLPAAGAGQGTSWRLDWGPSAGAEASVTRLVGLAVVAAAVLVVVYLRETAALAWRRRAALLGVRLAVVVLLILMLGRLSLRVDRTELPTVAVLIDTSASMGLADQYSDPADAKLIRELTAGRPGAAPTRLQLVQALLKQRGGAWWLALESTHRIRLYAFDQHLRSLETDAIAEAPVGEYAALIADLTTTGELTAPATVLRELLDDVRGADPAAVILWTDGIASAGDEERFSRAALAARERGVPLYPVAVGSRDPSRDLELFDPVAATEINLGEPVTLSLRHRQFGLAGQTTELQVLAEGVDAPWVSRPLELGASAQETSTEVTFTPQSEGEFDLTVAAAALPGETDLENNQLRMHLTVRRDQLRVLLVEGRPRWEYRALKPVLERDEGLQLETFLQSADLDYAPEDRTALRAFPATQDELDQYDVILWGDVALDSLDDGVDDRLRSFVRDHGGGLVFVAGEESNPLSYAGTSLELLLPVSLLEATIPLADGNSPKAAFRLQRTQDGQAQAFLRLADDVAEDEAAWQSLPSELHWYVATPEIKPGATVLAEGGGALGGLPLVVQQAYGRGRVLYHGVDSLWTWRKRVEDRYYGRYWSQVVRALAAGRRRRDDFDRQLTSDRRVYELGDEISLRLSGPPGVTGEVESGVSVAIDSQAGARTKVVLEPRPDDSTIWEAIVRDLPLGEFRASLEAIDEQTSTSCVFRVQLPNRELRQREADLSDLQQAARLSHGKAYSLATAGRIAAEIPRGRPMRLTESEPIGLWNRWELLLFCISLLAGEWLLRKGSRLV